MDNRILIYSLFALYGLFTIVLVVYIQMKFRAAAGVLQKLKTEWDTADARHAGFVGVAQERISKLAIPATTPQGKQMPVTFDTRNQVVAMAKRGVCAVDIARACGLQEGDLDVILGMARLQK